MTHIFYLVDPQLPGLLARGLKAWPGCRQFTQATLDELTGCPGASEALLIVETKQWYPTLMSHLQTRLAQSDLPCIVICRHASEADSRSAIACGVTTFITGKLEGGRLAVVLSTALARHQRDRQLLKALASTRRQLADRQDIEKAKGVLMQAQGLSEDDAYQKLRREAMKRQERIGDLARQILAMQSLL